jgi:hypothetical protein
MNEAMLELGKWDSFYVIVGSAAGALIGLQFVVMTLIAGRPRPPAEEAGAAFATPTIVHFSTVLLLSALLRAPWPASEVAAGVIGGLGLCGVVYTAAVARRIRKQNAYRPQFEDWLCHFALPLVAYAGIGLSALATGSYPREALFGVGTGALLLLFTGIHNAWDAVTWHVLVDNPDAKAGRSNKELR